MALIDRLKDATKPTNTIEAVQPQPDLGQRQEPRLLQTTSAAPAAPSSPAETLPRPTPALTKAPAYATEPEAISRAYYVEDRGSERRYYDDYQRKALAFRADDTSISTKREDLTTIRAALALAEAKGWSEVKVNGSAEFKRETWIEATARGITAQGYKASDLDRQEADRRRAERGPDQARPTLPDGANEVRRVAPSSQPGAPSPSQPAVDASQAPARQSSLDANAMPQAKPGDGLQTAPSPEAAQTRKGVTSETEKSNNQPPLAPVPANWDAAQERFNAERYALTEARFSVATLATAIKSRDAEPQSQQALATSFVNSGVTQSNNAFENVWKQPELASSLSAQNLTLKGVQADLTAERLDGVSAALEKTEKDLSKRQTIFANAIADLNRQAEQARKVTPTETEKPTLQPTTVDHRKVAKDAAAALSDDGKLVYAALSEKIDRQVNKLSAESKAELKAFAATELVKKERAEGPVVLTKEQRQLATAPEPSQRQSAAPQPAPVQVQVQVQERAPVMPERAPRPSPTEPEIERPSRRRSR